MILEIDDIIPFSKRHKGETVRQIVRYDSGYLKDLFLKDERICFSEECWSVVDADHNKECFSELTRLTQNHEDNWEMGSDTGNIFTNLKPYATPYLYCFDDEKLRTINEERISNHVAI